MENKMKVFVLATIFSFSCSSFAAGTDCYVNYRGWGEKIVDVAEFATERAGLEDISSLETEQISTGEEGQVFLVTVNGIKKIVVHTDLVNHASAAGTALFCYLPTQEKRPEGFNSGRF